MATIIVYRDVESLAKDLPYRFFLAMFMEYRKPSIVRSRFQETFHYRIGDKKGEVVISGPEPDLNVTGIDVGLTGQQMYDKARDYIPIKHRPDPEPTFEHLFRNMRM